MGDATDDAQEPSPILRLRGLPFQTAEEDVREFFKGFNIKEVHICKRSGRLTGEAYVEFDTDEAAANALKQLDRKYIGQRYIECVAGCLRARVFASLACGQASCLPRNYRFYGFGCAAYRRACECARSCQLCTQSAPMYPNFRACRLGHASRPAGASFTFNRP